MEMSNEFYEGQLVRVEWPDKQEAAEGKVFFSSTHQRHAIRVNGSLFLLNRDDGRRVTVLKPVEPVKPGSIIMGRTVSCGKPPVREYLIRVLREREAAYIWFGSKSQKFFCWGEIKDVVLDPELL